MLYARVISIVFVGKNIRTQNVRFIKKKLTLFICILFLTISKVELFVYNIWF